MIHTTNMYLAHEADKDKAADPFSTVMGKKRGTNEQALLLLESAFSDVGYPLLKQYSHLIRSAPIDALLHDLATISTRQWHPDSCAQQLHEKLTHAFADVTSTMWNANTMAVLEMLGFGDQNPFFTGDKDSHYRFVDQALQPAFREHYHASTQMSLSNVAHEQYRVLLADYLGGLVKNDTKRAQSLITQATVYYERTNIVAHMPVPWSGKDKDQVPAHERITQEAWQQIMLKFLPVGYIDEQGAHGFVGAKITSRALFDVSRKARLHNAIAARIF